MLSLIGRLLGGAGWALTRQAEAQPREPLQYPADVTLDGVRLTVRLLQASDRQALLAFARALPPHDLLFLRRDITRSDQVDAWLGQVSDGLYTSVIALRDEEIEGVATVARDGLSWTSHVAELRVLVSERMRRKKLGRLLTEQAFAHARQLGVTKMMAQMTPDQLAAVKVFRRMGFRREARLSRHVRDRHGMLHDLLIMSLDVAAFEARLEVISMGVSDPLTGY